MSEWQEPAALWVDLGQSKARENKLHKMLVKSDVLSHRFDKIVQHKSLYMMHIFDPKTNYCESSFSHNL